MGVEKLWEVLAPAATTVSLPLLALQDRFQGGPPHTPYRIGVDVSILFERCQQVLMLRAHPQSGQNPALRTFFYRVTHLLRLPLQLVFCYDGDERPVRKREHNVSTKDHWMVKPTQRILDSLGIPWFRARGEAEAELAAMNAVGLIDAVMTDDSDVFVFGAQAVLRSSSLTANDTITLYTADGIQDKISPSLDCDGFILMALLCGGDYDTKGLVGCGSATALGLVRCGLAKAICFAMRTSSDRARSLTEWRHKLREHLLSDPTDDIGRRHPALASLVPDTFPDISVIDSYANPIILADAQRFHLGCPQPPNVANVAAIAQELFGWDDPTKLLKTFRKHVWPACVLQEVLQDLNSSSSSDEVELVPDATRVFFLHTKRSAKELNNAPGFNICIPTASLIGDTLSQLKRIEDFADGQESTSRGLNIWVSKHMYESWVSKFTHSGSPQIINTTLNRNILDDQPSSSTIEDSVAEVSSSGSDYDTDHVNVSECSALRPQDNSDVIDLTHVDDDDSLPSRSPIIIDLTNEDSPQVSGPTEDADTEIIDLTV